MSSNGQITAEQAQAIQQPPSGKPRYGRGSLSPRDFKRARVMLGGRDPEEVLRGDWEDAAALLLWCVKTRSDPSFTWDQAVDTPFDAFDEVFDVEEGPQQPGEEAASPGSKRKRSGGNASKLTRPTVEPERSSAPSTA